MTSVIFRNGVLTDISNDNGSSIFGSAKTHQSNIRKASSRLNFPRLDSSEETPSEHSSLCDAGHCKSEDDGHHARSPSDATRELPGDSSKVDQDESLNHSTENIDADLEDVFITSIRPHGAPLDTITERTSVATIQEPLHPLDIPLSAGAMDNFNRKSSAPEATLLRQWRCEDRRLTKSLDESTLEIHRTSPRLRNISETPEECQTNDVAKPAMPVLPPPQRINTPPGLPRWPGDLPTSLPKPSNPVNRTTSAYVRGIYRKLVGTDQRDSKSPNSSSPSKIPIPAHLALGGRTGKAYWKAPEGAHSKKNLLQVNSSPFQDAEKGVSEHVSASSPRHLGTSSPTTSVKTTRNNGTMCENFDILKATSSSLSNVLARTSRLLDSPKSLSSRGKSSPNKISPRPSTPTPAALLRDVIQKPAEENQLPRSENPASLKLIYSKLPQADSVPAIPTNISIRNRSIFDIRATEPRESAHSMDDHGESETSKPSLLEIRNGIPSTPISEAAADGTPNSWDLPLDPFPQPPSPNYFVTPPSSLHFRDDSALYRYTSAGIAVEQPFAPSLSSIDIAAEESAVRSIAASDSSASLVAGQSLSQRLPHHTRNGSDPFLPQVQACAVGSSGGKVRHYDSPASKRTPIQMPSPLRPRSKQYLKYSLFPEEQPPMAASKPGVKDPRIRNLRSLSSMLRIPSMTMRASKSSELGHTQNANLCSHGKPVDRINVFSGRKLGGRAWRVRHWARDGDLRCWKCQTKLIRDRFRGLSCGLCNRQKTPESRRRRDDVISTDSAGSALLVVHRKRSRGPPIVTRHPLEEIEEKRADRDKKLDGSASINRAMALGSRWASWAPGNCFCQVVDDGNSARTSSELASTGVRVARVRSIIE